MNKIIRKHSVQIILFVFAACMVLLFATSCKKEKENDNSTLEVSSDSLFFSENQRKFLFLSTESSRECSYSIESVPNWITVDPSSGRFSSDDTELISITSNISSLESGVTVDQMILKSNLGDHTITLIAQKGYPTGFSLPESLLFPTGINSNTLTLKNTGHEAFEYYISPSSYYIYTDPSQGYLQPNGQVEIRVYIEREYLDYNPYLCFYINGENYYVPIVLEEINYSVNDELFFGSDANNATLSIRNTGTTNFLYSVEAATNYITLSSNTTGTLTQNQQVDINVSIDKDAILANHIEPSLNVTINDIVVNVPIVIERKQMLTKDIIDAEYSKAKDIMVYVAADLTLNIYHTVTKVTDVVTLSYMPTCVSISLDGTKAVVGHDAHVTYINLETKQILTENDISCYALDVVLGSNGWAYAFPKRDQWEHVRCIDVTIPNSIEQAHTGNTIYAGAVAKLHPSGKYIYDAENGISSMSIEKFDIQNGVADYLYCLSYSYSAGGDLWFSESGDRIFAKNGNVFKSSDFQQTDLMYNGKITLESSSYYSPSIKYLDHLELNKCLYIISRGGDYDDPNKPFVYIYNSENLTYKSKKALESYYVTDSYGESTAYPAEPYFVFANSNGRELYVITKAVGSGLVHEWALQIFDIGE